jgi:hypothetical protein
MEFPHSWIQSLLHKTPRRTHGDTREPCRSGLPHAGELQTTPAVATHRVSIPVNHTDTALLFV